MNLDEKLNDLDAKLNGDYWIVRCPSCGRREAYIYVDDVEKAKTNPKHKIPIRCNRANKCGVVNYLRDVNIQYVPKIKDEDIIGISKKGLDKIQALAQFNDLIIGYDFDWRGISNQTLKVNGVIYYPTGFQDFMKKAGKGVFADKFLTNSYYEDRDIIIPIKDYDGKCQRMLLRSTKKLESSNKKEINMRLIKNSSEVWNRKDIIDENMPYIFVTEGVPDGLSIKEVKQGIGVVSLPGVKKYRQLIKEIKRNQVGYEKTYVLCFDNDNAGKEFEEKLINNLDELNIKWIQFNLHNYKDMNDFLLGNKKLFTDEVLKSIGESKKKRFKFKRSCSCPAEEIIEEITKRNESYKKFTFQRKSTCS